MKAIYALYPDPGSAREAFNSLRRAAPELGIAARDVVVASSEPFDEYDFGRHDAKTPMPWLAAVGGLLGGSGGYWLAAFTQKAYPLPTGGMPIVAPWTNGIVAYEMAMLGAILATFLTLLASARLPDLRHRLYDLEISGGKILVGVIKPPEDSRFEIEKALLQAGASDTKEFLG